jgi:hypothetical protein
MKKSIHLLFFFLFLQCSQNPFDPPQLNYEITPPEVNTSIHAIYERVKQSPTNFYKYSKQENPLWLEAYVSSSDAAGNFYKELYLQDAPGNPQSAMRLLLDQTAIYNSYPVGRKLFVKLNGLAAGLHRGVLTLGSYQADGIENLPQYSIEEHLMRSDQDFEIQPKNVEVSDFEEEMVGQWIQLDGVQFSEAERGRTYAAQAFDQFDGERRLLHCKTHHNIWLSSSTFCKFKSVVIPGQAGTLKGILTRDFRNEKYIIKVNSPGDLQFEDSRCDPFFEEHFETTTRGKLQIEAWLNYTEEGSPYWKVAEEETTLGRSASISAYASEDAKSVVWLIGPSIDLSGLSKPYFAFRSAVKYGDKSLLEVLISTDFKGTTEGVTTAHWKKLDLKIASRMDGNSIWIDSGDYDLKDFKNQKVHFGFRYTGSGKSTYDATFFVDDIRVMDQ